MIMILVVVVVVVAAAVAAAAAAAALVGVVNFQFQLYLWRGAKETLLRLGVQSLGPGPGLLLGAMWVVPKIRVGFRV